MDGDRDRDPHQRNRLSSQDPVENQKEGKDSVPLGVGPPTEADIPIFM